MKISGVVIETCKKRNMVTVYTSNGQFLKVPAPRFDIKTGEIIEVPQNATRCVRKTMLSMRVISAAAAVFALVMFLSIYLAFFTVPVSAYVALDFNPSLELKINKQAKVMDVRSINEDADKLLKDLNLKDANVYKAVEKIMDKAIALGYIKLDEKNLVIASVVPVGEETVVDREKLESVIANNIQQKEIDSYILVDTSNEKTRNIAAENGLSVNRYKVMEHYHEAGLNISAQEINNKNMMDIMKDNNIYLTKKQDYTTLTHQNEINPGKNAGMQNNSDMMETSGALMSNNMDRDSSKSQFNYIQRSGDMKNDTMHNGSEKNEQTMESSRTGDTDMNHDQYEDMKYPNKQMNHDMSRIKY
ncbi:anti-sigma factor domain-containing protein [Desulfoscipio geothermicus]|uniref:Anti-sigma factor N-terminus n=1 Tax=Desulfoscipio geothermicus DSM 3669 TaxID=1121426 RepID=A0A1I6D0S7_9FIRM|nr:anti-sigma factor domain-containing protein [Desulfoscipio geothermicus]SFQ99098.1 Anti-sigma factor N-terminus [Desulfoscipio geothermicus DSM 3669]